MKFLKLDFNKAHTAIQLYSNLTATKQTAPCIFTSRDRVEATRRPHKPVCVENAKVSSSLAPATTFPLRRIQQSKTWCGSLMALPGITGLALQFWLDAEPKAIKASRTC